MTAEPSRSILIVEHDQIVAEDLQDSLTELGYDAFAIAATADEAIEHVTERCPDLVLMDIRITGSRDGIETAAMLRRRFDVPVVYLTAHTERAALVRAKTAEPYAYLTKPVKAAELFTAIEFALHRHAIERRLRQRERWFSTTLRSIADAVITVDLAGAVTFMNPAAERLTGVAAADALGRPARDVMRVLGPDGAPVGELQLHRALHDGQVATLEATLVTASDGRRAISDCTSPVIEDGELLGAVVVLRDITEQQRMQRQLEVADRLASLGTLSAGLSHEINNPLAVVIATADYLRGELDEVTGAARAGASGPELVGRLTEVSQIQGEISAAGGRIAKVITDLRALSRPAEPPSGEADVGRAIQWALRTTAHEFRHRARLSQDVPAMPPALADETRLGQALVNLLKNAAQAIEPGRAGDHEVAIRARAERRRIIVEVRDTGPGIPPDDLRQIFEPFFTTRAVGEGTGLGLSVCHGIVASMGGEIQVDSAVGAGTTIRIVLRAASQLTAPPVRGPAPSAAGRRGRILVVDDDPLIHRTMKRLLREHELVSEEHAQDALARLARGERFDVILSDLMMPTMTGIEFYDQLRVRHPELVHRVVFVTGGALATAGADQFLRSVRNVTLAKPFGKPELEAVIAGMLAGQAAPGARP